MAHPFRMVAHNGKINTIGANRRWSRVREKDIAREIGAGEWFRPLWRDGRRALHRGTRGRTVCRSQ
jgi:hypothetical protein